MVITGSTAWAQLGSGAVGKWAPLTACWVRQRMGGGPHAQTYTQKHNTRTHTCTARAHAGHGAWAGGALACAHTTAAASAASWRWVCLHASPTTCYPEQLPPLTLHTRALQPAKSPLQTVRANNLRKALALYRCQYVLLSTVHPWAPTPTHVLVGKGRPAWHPVQHTLTRSVGPGATHTAVTYTHTLSYKPQTTIATSLPSHAAGLEVHLVQVVPTHTTLQLLAPPPIDSSGWGYTVRHSRCCPHIILYMVNTVTTAHMHSLDGCCTAGAPPSRPGHPPAAATAAAGARAPQQRPLASHDTRRCSVLLHLAAWTQCSHGQVANPSAAVELRQAGSTGAGP